MKTKIYSLLTFSLIVLTIISCKKDDANVKQLILTGQLISNSECKSNLKSGSQIVETPDSLSCVEYVYDNEKNKLTLKHINAGFNCCPDSLYCKVELKGDTIIIQEFEKTAQCDCNCLYDLEIEINGVDMQKYKVKFEEPYVAEMDKLLFEIDLNNDLNGTFCVTRKQYPWGMDSLN